eukprot:Hpha_TRINITY_DN21832_c0_g1::TRINITY_DN21832_c0_g1_i1::g.21904::m.21904
MEGEDSVETLRAKLAEAEAGERRQKEKLKEWKRRAETIIEGEREEIRKLRDEKAAREADCAEWRRRAERAEADMRSGGAQGGVEHSGSEGLAAQLAAAQRDAERIQADFEKYKQQTSTALRLKSRAAAGDRDRMSSVEEELRAAQREVDDLKGELAEREAECRKATETGMESGAELARLQERCSEAVELANRRVEQAEWEIERRAADEIAAISERWEQQLQSLQVLHDSELAELNGQLEAFAGQARLEAQARVDALLVEGEGLKEELGVLREELQETRRERDELKHRR